MKTHVLVSPETQIAKSDIKIVLVENQTVAFESWANRISRLPGFTCVASCTSGEEALQVIPRLVPDVVLIDIVLPQMSGLECITQLKSLVPEVRILIFTSSEKCELVFLALKSGADGYLLRRTKPQKLRAAMLEVLRGGAPMGSEIALLVVKSFQKPALPSKSAVYLSAREEEILSLASQGYYNKEIAEKLSLGMETVRNDLKKAYDKLNARNRIEATIKYRTFNPYVIRNGLDTVCDLAS
jgi:DNA-binding NarL/FixJ family response regulator